MSRGFTPNILAYLKEREELKKKFYQDQRNAVIAGAKKIRPVDGLQTSTGRA